MPSARKTVTQRPPETHAGPGVGGKRQTQSTRRLRVSLTTAPHLHLSQKRLVEMGCQDVLALPGTTAMERRKVPARDIKRIPNTCSKVTSMWSATGGGSKCRTHPAGFPGQVNAHACTIFLPAKSVSTLHGQRERSAGPESTWSEANTSC